jgi:hypothetical protein
MAFQNVGAFTLFFSYKKFSQKKQREKLSQKKLSQKNFRKKKIALKKKGETRDLPESLACPYVSGG